MPPIHLPAFLHPLLPRCDHSPKLYFGPFPVLLELPPTPPFTGWSKLQLQPDVDDLLIQSLKLTILYTPPTHKYATKQNNVSSQTVSRDVIIVSRYPSSNLSIFLKNQFC